MSIRRRYFRNIKCDCCGAYLADDEWFDQSADDPIWDTMLEECNWIAIGKRHFCPSCYILDENDELIPLKNNRNNKKWN